MIKWHIRDIIDLEYFLYKDADSLSVENQHSLHERDRNIFLESVMPGLEEEETPERQYLIKTWLSRRREAEKAKAHVLPGESVEGLYGTFCLVFLVAGLVLGGALGASFLTYTGDRPVNVFVYLSVFVIFQLLLLLLLFVLSMYRLQKSSFLSASPLYTLISRLLLRILLSTRKKVTKRLSSGQRLLAEFTFGTLVGKSRTYGILLILPIFILTQIFAIGFNLGLLSSTLFKVVTADIAFGWQSTIQLSPAGVYSLVQKIALPWSWAVPAENAFPSLLQIEGSRIILKEGIYNLSTPSLASWWPFLCFAVLVYGLLPRLLLFLGAVWAKRRYLHLLDFRQGVYEQLLQRMTSPLVTTKGRTVADRGAGPKESELEDHVLVKSPSDKMRCGKNLLVVMIPDEIFDACSREEIEAVVNKGQAYAIQEIIRINQDFASDQETIANLCNRNRLAETDVLIVQEAWQPPIMECIDFIKNIRSAVGEGPCLRIGLIGKPLPMTVFTPVKDENRKIWAQKITAIGDPCIYSGALVHNAS